MPAIAHLGVGFAAKKIAPEIPVIYLIIAAELIEMAFFVLVAAGVENMPLTDIAPFSPYSHGVLSGIIWSLLAAAVTFLMSRNRKASIIIGLLVLSHTILDIIASPKLAFYPTDTKIPLFSDNSVSVGLGLWKHKTIAYIGEFGFLTAGLIIYFLTIRKVRLHRQPLA